MLIAPRMDALPQKDRCPTQFWGEKLRELQQGTRLARGGYWSLVFLPPCLEAFLARWRARSEAPMSSAF